MTASRPPFCDIVMVTWNAVAMTTDALRSLRGSGFPYRLVLVDNSDEEEARAFYRQIAASGEFGDILLHQNEANIGWLRATNIGLGLCTAPYVCLLNNDVICGEDWLRRCVALLETEASLGLLNPRGNERSENRLVSSVDAYARQLAGQQGGQYTELDHCAGFCMLARRSLIEQVGLLDEAYGAGYYEDNDYSRRVQALGYRCAQCDDAFVLHLGSQSFKKVADARRALIAANQQRYEQRWGRVPRCLVALAPSSAELDVALWQDFIRAHRVYLLDNGRLPAGLRDFRHQHLTILPRRPWPQALLFAAQAAYLARKKRIDFSARVFDGRPPAIC